MPLEDTCDMWESFQVVPGTGRKLTFHLFSALQGQSLCITNRLQASPMLLDTDTCPKTVKVTFFKELRGLTHEQDDAPPSESQ